MSARALTFWFVYNVTIHIAAEAMERMRVDGIRRTIKAEEARKEAERQRARDAEQRRMEAEQQRAREIEQRAREAEQRRMEAERQRVRDRKRRAAQRKMEEENIKKQTLAPLPAVIDRRADVPLTQYQYNDNASGVDGVYLISDTTAKAFFNDEYTRSFINRGDVNIEKFKKEFYHFVCAADSLWAWCHEQIETLAFDSKIIMKRLILALGMPYNLKQYPQSAANFRFMKYYFREWRKIWYDITKNASRSRALSAEDKLWAYFRHWFSDIRMGPIICHRAELVKTEFEFSSKPAQKANSEPNYALKDYKEMDKALMKLYKSEKGISGAVERDDIKKITNKVAVVQNDSNQLNDENNDIIDDNVATAGGSHQVISDESPPTTDNKKDYELKNDYFEQHDGDEFMNDKLKAKESKGQAYGNTNHGGIDETKRQAFIKDEESNKDLKAGAKKDDAEHEYIYSEEEEEEEEEEDDDWNSCYSRNDDDMSLCGKVPSETDYSLVGI